MGTNPEYWGSDSLVWRPDRFIKTSRGKEEFHQPVPSVYQYWSSGPRVCPGKKFSQVEFVAVFACLFQENRVVPVLEKGETMKDARKRINEVLYDSRIISPALKMAHPEKIRLAWEKIV
jgi:cytochrome P450